MSATPAAVHARAHAKANLFLRILAREASGYHTIETLFTLLELADDVTVEAIAGGVELSVEGDETGPPEENLATRAARLILAATGTSIGVRIRLVKRIPIRAGLGGGSSDGAATLHAVNALLGNPVPRHEILQLAARLGSDVTFFASGAPLALAWGRGDRLFRVPPPPPAPALIAVPPFGVSTPDAYRLVDAASPGDSTRGGVLLDTGAFESWGSIARLGGNDFETTIFGVQPGLRDLFEEVAGTRPLLVRMSGSGSAILGLYRAESDRDGAVAIVGRPDRKTLKTTTRARAPDAPSRDGVSTVATAI